MILFFISKKCLKGESIGKVDTFDVKNDGKDVDIEEGKDRSVYFDDDGEFDPQDFEKTGHADEEDVEDDFWPAYFLGLLNWGKWWRVLLVLALLLLDLALVLLVGTEGV